jgi:hypothetical protein
MFNGRLVQTCVSNYDDYYYLSGRLESSNSPVEKSEFLRLIFSRVI